MAFQGNPQSECGRTEQIISQFLLKSLHIIIDSRIPSLHISNDRPSDFGVAKKKDKWFNLALGDPPAALESLNFWHRSIIDPMIIDVILVHDSPVSSAAHVEHLYSALAPRETVVERWIVQYEPLRAASQSGEGPASYKKMYKKSIILLRSLYSTLRLLPAFRIFRLSTCLSQTYSFNLSYKVSSFTEPFTRSQEEEMKLYNFTPIETPFGRLSLSLTYRATFSDLNLESSNSLPPLIIADYIGSPATDALKVFSSSDRGTHATSFPVRRYCTPSSTPLQRPHSWTSGIHRSGPTTHHSYSSSPPPYLNPSSLSNFSNSPPEYYGQKIPNYRPMGHKKGTSFDEHRLSPPFSPSSSPSPPTYLSGANSPFHTRLRAESAPVSIPFPMAGKNHRYLTPNSSDPNKHFLPPPSPRSLKAEHSSGSPSESRSFRKLDGLRAGEYYSGSANLHGYSKVFRDSRDDSGRFSGVVSSSGSPRVGFSRSSSRLSFQDDLDDCEFSCPFAVDDVDTSDTPTRACDGKDAPEFTSIQAFPSSKTSQDAAVGILVHMLRTAPPLRQDPSYSSQSSKSEFDGQIGASGFVSRRASDALEELRGYREMSDLLLSRGGSGTQYLGSGKQKASSSSQ